MRLKLFGRRLSGDESGVAMLEFAFMMPIFVTMCVGGTELANFITTRLRVSQIALQIADNAARIGSGTKLAAKKITDSDINDLFIGAQLESGNLNLKANGRVILSDVEPMANTDDNATYKIGWQRCYGDKTAHVSTYGTSGQTDLAGVGPTGAGRTQAVALNNGATMFVEVYYSYKPLISSIWVPTTEIVETASMSVRDRRDLTNDASAGATAVHPDGVYKVTGVTPSSC